MKVLNAFVALAAISGSLLLAGNLAGAPVRTVSVGGSLSDADGHPLEGAYAFRVEFFGPDSAALDTVDTSATLVAGTFNLPVAVSDAVLDQEEVSYRLWADVDRDGLTASDRFPDLFKLTAVPRSLRTEPGGTFRGLNGGLTTQVYGLAPTSTPFVALSTLELPPGGVKFNTLTFRASTNIPGVYQALNETNYQVGCYNAKGDLVARADMALNLPQSTTTVYVQVAVPEAYLPGGTNYSAITSNVKNNPNGLSYYVRYLAGPTVSVDPFVQRRVGAITVPNAELPGHIDDITARDTTTQAGPAVTLQYLEEAENLPPGAYRRSDQETQYQWILPSEKSFF